MSIYPLAYKYVKVRSKVWPVTQRLKILLTVLRVIMTSLNQL